MALKRLRDFLAATYHEVMDELENPEAMLKQYLREVEKEIEKAKDTIVKQQMMGKEFARQLEEAKKLAARREKQAQIAFQAGEEELSRKAFAEMKHYEAKAKEYQEYTVKSEEQVKELREQLGKLEKKYQDLKDKKNDLVARAAVAKAKYSMNATLSFVASDSALKEFKRIEDRITEMEIKANSYANAGLGGEDLSFAKVEYADEVEQELEKLRGTKSETDNGKEASQS
ncbi:PspA/IM30 family protein [Paenactinomyces guangxiensis]|uniref:PspA/IM30 family protein n=1 Tax=Paenactinomyces guangxiensis TaxID=1490290 RepID=A0A7W2A8G7_9BACL|nr:PspA/IM30 family protein [Paenactinomyces guangxiensis]MBA4494147.1 PspA/IM30 family protein [Paenactinomyces guangxiensis]MBH8591108.1 PspA/IM30 family protein [Paenactinomyces guangxiensis]